MNTDDILFFDILIIIVTGISCTLLGALITDKTINGTPAIILLISTVTWIIMFTVRITLHITSY